MANDTVPIFVVGSGRNGTRMIFKLLSGVPDIEVHHEYVCTHIQALAAQYFMQLKSKEEVKQDIRELHGAAIHYSPSRYWIDCSNKLSWIIQPLLELFPQAKFIHLTRDGRKVTGSFFHKLAPEIYDDISVGVMQNWLKDRSLPMPPPEKKYWWNIPRPGQPFYEAFPGFNQFQRICYHWREVTRVIMESLCKVPAGQQLTIKLEDLTQDREATKRFLEFVGIEYEEHYYEFLQRPQNVFFPMDFKLTDQEVEQFAEITGETMARTGYDINSEMYEVKY
jgi:Sulfotransferase family